MWEVTNIDNITLLCQSQPGLPSSQQPCFLSIIWDDIGSFCLSRVNHPPTTQKKIPAATSLLTLPCPWCLRFHLQFHEERCEGKQRGCEAQDEHSKWTVKVQSPRKSYCSPGEHIEVAQALPVINSHTSSHPGKLFRGERLLSLRPVPCVWHNGVPALARALVHLLVVFTQACPVKTRFADCFVTPSPCDPRTTHLRCSRNCFGRLHGAKVELSSWIC